MPPVSKSAETIEYFVNYFFETKHILDAFKNGKNLSLQDSLSHSLKGKLSIGESGSSCKCTLSSVSLLEAASEPK